MLRIIFILFLYSTFSFLFPKDSITVTYEYAMMMYISSFLFGYCIVPYLLGHLPFPQFHFFIFEHKLIL